MANTATGIFVLWEISKYVVILLYWKTLEPRWRNQIIWIMSNSVRFYCSLVGKWVILGAVDKSVTNKIRFGVKIVETCGKWSVLPGLFHRVRSKKDPSPNMIWIQRRGCSPDVDTWTCLLYHPFFVRQPCVLVCSTIETTQTWRRTSELATTCVKR